jgi:flavin-dependent dehydrogenase
MKIGIIGCGPAGACAAYYANKAGHEVTVYERSKEFARKPCGDGLVKRGMDIVPDVVPKAQFTLREFRRTKMYWYFDFMRLVEHDHMPIYTVDKPEMIAEIMNYAGSGTRLITSKIQNLNHLKDLYDLIVIADGGANSMARTYMDYAPRMIPVLRVYASTSELDDSFMHMFMMDNGYMWAFPIGDHLFNIGVGQMVREKDNNQELLKALIMKFNFVLRDKVVGSPIVIDWPSRQLHWSHPNASIRARVVAIGEAVGQVMAPVGEGDSWGMIAGSICFKDTYEQDYAPYIEQLVNGKTLLDQLLQMESHEKREMLRTAPMELLDQYLTG